VLRTWADRRPEPLRVFESIGRLDWLCWILALVAFQIVCMDVGLSAQLQAVEGGIAFTRETLYLLVAFFLVLPAVVGPQDRGVTRRFLRLTPMVYLGTISYGIYLWHQAFIKKIHQWGGWAPGPGENPLLGFRGSYLVHFLGALALSAVVATFSWYVIERPLLRRKDVPFNRWGERSAQERSSTGPV
jgi:peptidoglycan/LPS O-acetylase OafA/YrhL